MANPVLLTSNTGKELSGKGLDLAVRERHKGVAFQEIEDTLSQQIHDNTDVSSVIETVPQMYTSVSIFPVVGFQGRQNSEFYPRSITVLLNRPDDLDCNRSILFLVSSLYHLAKCALAKEFGDRV